MKKIGLVLLLTILFVTLATPALADGPDDDVVIWGDNYTLKSGQTIKGDLLVYTGNVNLLSESTVAGDVTLFGGNLTIAGEVDGDVTVWGGNVKIQSSATIRGQVVSIGGNVSREEGADVRGEEIEGFPFRAPTPPRAPIPPKIPRLQTYRDWETRWVRNLGNVFRSAFGMIVMVVLGILLSKQVLILIQQQNFSLNL